MMHISKLFGLQKSQYELDFVDIDIDTKLFLDPYFISKMDFPFAEEAYLTMKSFFDYLLSLLRNQYLDKAKEIFSYLGESNEICLGMSNGKPSGRGMGPTDAEKIFNSLVESKAYQTGVMEDIEDLRIFVPNVDKDKISDMVANIIKELLINYTQDQCKLWGISLHEGVPSGYYWDKNKNEWCNKYTEMLIVDNRKIILVPKRIVSYSNKYTDKQYIQHYALNFLQNEHLRLNSSLVRERVKSKEKYVTKKDVKEFEERKRPIDKKWLTEFTLKHDDIFADFKRNTIKNIKPITNEEMVNIDLDKIIFHLKNQLLNMPTGPDFATKYHHLILGIMELIFYPFLSTPRVENEIHDGRKRIDITFDNCADSGFFYRLCTSYNVPSRFIIVECKNYSRDINNPELDQLSGRFSPNRGKFGIAVCRKIEKMDLFISRCNDTVKDDRGIIIPLVDDDFIYILDNFKNKGYEICERIIQDRFHRVNIG